MCYFKKCIVPILSDFLEEASFKKCKNYSRKLRGFKHKF